MTEKSKCSGCRKYPCEEMIKASQTLSGNLSLELAVRDILEGFISKVGCESAERVGGQT